MLLAFSATLSAAQSGPELQAVKLTTPPAIDGSISEGEWDEAATASNFEDPTTSRLAADQTRVWYGYTDEAIYIAFYAYDSQPDKIVAREVQPGTEMEGDDVVEFTLDTFNTKTQGSLNWFVINPLGTQFEDISGGRAGKREWRGEWQSEASIVSDGWVCEVRIPWNVFTYPKGENLKMALNFGRFQQRTQVYSEWANTTEAERLELLGEWAPVNPPKATIENPLQILAYVSPDYDEEAKDDLTVRSGLDARYRFTSQLTGILSINPDFKNIDQDVADIGFTRSERFVGDARPFFKEGGDLFTLTGRYTYGRMFFSRRIGEFDQGAKVYGNIAPDKKIGVLFTRTAGESEAGVFNYVQDFTPRTNFNVFATSLTGVDEENFAFGGTFRIGEGHWDADFSMSQASDHGVTDTAGSASVAYSIPKLFSIVRFYYTGPDFEPALALVPFTGFRGGYWFNEFTQEFRTGYIREFQANLFAESLETYSGDNFSKALELTASVETRDDLGFEAQLYKARFLEEDEQFLTLNAGYNVSNRFKQLEVGYQVGEIDGERIEFIAVGGSYRLFQGFDLGLDYSALSFDGHSTRAIVTLGWEIDERQSLSARFLGRDGSSNFSLAYSSSGFSGTEYYVVVGDPNALEWRNRIAVKVVWAF